MVNVAFNLEINQITSIFTIIVNANVAYSNISMSGSGKISVIFVRNNITNKNFIWKTKQKQYTDN